MCDSTEHGVSPTGGLQRKHLLPLGWIPLLLLASAMSLPEAKGGAPGSLPPHRIVILGGGVAGVTCCQEISACLSAGQAGAMATRVTLVAGKGLLKGVQNVVRMSRKLETFDIVDKAIDEVEDANTQVLDAEAVGIDVKKRTVSLRDGRVIDYDKLCVCTGASPARSSTSERVLTLRDTESTLQLSAKLKGARRVMIVGNGGIALELVHEIRGCEIVWTFRDRHIGNAFFDNDAAAFLAPALKDRLLEGGSEAMDDGSDVLTRTGGDWASQRVDASDRGEPALKGSSLGPEWLTGALGLAHSKSQPSSEGGRGALKGVSGGASRVIVERQCEVEGVVGEEGEWPVCVKLSNGREYRCDFVIQATGVQPNTQLVRGCEEVKLASDGGIVVDECMQSSCEGVFAAGDACTVIPEGSGWDEGGMQRKWFQMRLWTQAKAQGAWAARCMLGMADVLADPFELFAHATHFLGHKVVLLGRYNAQEMRIDDPEVKTYIRTTPGQEYIKVTLCGGRMQGALLLGETDLEETFENLILNGLDLSPFGEQILDPDIDLEDYFD